MRYKDMGKVLVTAMIENLHDLYDASKGRIKPEEVRSLEVPNALVDTGASTLSMPKSLVAKLGLTFVRNRQAITAAGTATLPMYGTVRLTIQGRDWTGDVAEVPDNCPVMVGQLPLEGLDFVVDPIGQRLVGNPEHGGEQAIELYSFVGSPQP